MLRRRRPVRALPSPACRLLGALGAASLFAVGCGGDDGGPPTESAYLYQGFWILQSYTTEADAGPETLERGGSPRALLGDARFLADSESAGTLDVLLATTDGDVLEAPPLTLVAGVSVEPGKWVVLSENDPADPADDTTAVYTTRLDGGDLTLSVDASDPRHDAIGGPTQLLLQRHLPWGSTTTGTWVVSSIDYGGGSVDPGVCTNVGMGYWAKLAITLAVNDLGLLDQAFATTTFANAGCTDAPPPPPTVVDIPGVVEEEGTTLRAWLYDPSAPSGGGMVTFDLSVAGADVTLDQSACTPADYCMDQPLQLVLSPAP